MGVTNLTAVNASAIGINGVPVSGSPALGPNPTNFDVLDVAQVVALDGVVLQGALQPGAIYTNYTSINAASILVAGSPLSPSGGGMELSGSAPTGAVGSAYSFVPTRTGGTAPFTFSQSGRLPPGVSFNTSTGELSAASVGI